MAAESYWFKINPEKYLSIAARIPDGVQRAEFLAICMHCLAVQGPLPDDDEEIAFITTIPVDHIRALRPYLARLCRVEDGQIIPTLAEDTIAERREFSEKQASNGRSGGKKTQAQPSEPKPPSSTAQAPLDEAQAIQTDKQTDKQNKQTAAAARAEFSEHSPPGDAAAAIEAISDLLKEFYQITNKSGWGMVGKLQSLAIELSGVEADVPTLRAFWAHRRKPPQIQYFAGDFVSWRAGQNGSTAQKTDASAQIAQIEADLQKRKERREKLGLSSV